MIKEFVKDWEDNKETIREAFSKAHPESYKEIVKAVISAISAAHDDDYDYPDPDRIHQIDDGDYQGTLLFLIPAHGYQPSDYFYVRVGYGSCSGCDTLQAIRDYEDGPPTEKQVNDYMTLALHILQGIKRLPDWDVEDM